MVELLLYGHPDSGHACKVAATLALAGLAHRVERVDIWAAPQTRPADFLAANPAVEVPVLMIDGQSHVQSGAILLEIATRWHCLGGESTAGLRRGRELLLWEANRIGMCLPQLVAARGPGRRAFAPEVVAWLVGRYAADRTRFDLLLGDGPFFHGDAPGIGDCAIWGYAQWTDRAGVAPSPAMAAWQARMRALPAMRSPEGFFPDAAPA
ncbi:glutathione S-transferase [Defluviimonas sp. 20V17]|uniref:Glutathione S-transferase n=1 Tax=Allgaiera indica TaxID=765699 RepID=A0AAN4UPM1_9RHOB|nr:glutathione S-transferase family protein [Allgaiera indica]KDB03727.1 glutathione S-transferase [Defluviimonas sp. 20V17]GHD99808.1 glutathione S-transferase [Allgaiera indica]SDW43302.1 glutathione S-transferase [Allgaiera indica]